jgi:serine/threonine protein kinase
MITQKFPILCDFALWFFSAVSHFPSTLFTGTLTTHLHTHLPQLSMGQGQNKGSGGDKEVSLADFEVLDVLGEGSFGKVWRVREKRGGRVLAMKRLLKRRVVDEDLVKHTITERDIMAALGPHPFVVKLEYAFATPAALYFVMEYLGGGSLFQHLRDRTEPFDSEGARFYAV